MWKLFSCPSQYSFELYKEAYTLLTEIIILILTQMNKMHRGLQHKPNQYLILIIQTRLVTQAYTRFPLQKQSNTIQCISQKNLAIWNCQILHTLSNIGYSALKRVQANS